MEERAQDMFQMERELMAGGDRLIAGIDEAGRGPLAGPVVVAAVILPPDGEFAGIDDSKKLTPRRREELAIRVKQLALAWVVTVVGVELIEELNILGATHYGMRQVALGLGLVPDMCLIDGPRPREFPLKARGVVGGDGLSYSIAAASILAKVTRDQLMEGLDEMYPGYGLAKHKGYPTREHIEAVRRLGPSAIHRSRFVAKYAQPTLF